MIQIVSVLGSLAILGAYTASQLGRLSTSALSYSVANAVGAAILSAVAVVERQWGFLLLESVWTLVSLAAVWRVVRRRSSEVRESE
jgi:hypothetical protein